MPYKNKDQQQAYQREYYQKNKNRRRRVVVTLSVKEFATLDSAANKEKTSVAKLLKQFAVAYHNGTFVVPCTTAESLQHVIRILRNYGNLVNQIARNYNAEAKTGQFHYLPKEVRRTLEQIHSKLNRLEKQFLIFTQTPPQ